MRRRGSEPDASGTPSDLPDADRRRWAARLALWLGLLLVWLGALRLAPQAVLGPPPVDAAVDAVRAPFAVVVSAGLALLTVHAIWRLRLETLAFRPGPLLVHAIPDRTGGTGSANGETPLGEKVRAELQRALIGTRLHGSTAIPSPGRSSDFVQVVEEIGQGAEGVLGAVLRVPRAINPRSSYEVRCTITTPLTGDGRRPTLLVELTRAPKYVLAPQTFTGASWPDVTREVANWICAMILPRTRRTGTPPWAAWRGLRLPPELFDAHQRFREFQREDPEQGRFPDYPRALECLQRALAMDPLNLALRLERGKLLERMGRFLEALESYDGLLAQAARRDRRLAYLRFGPPPIGREEPEVGADRRWSDPSRGRRDPGDDPIVFLARYRFALLLGLGDRLADEWWPGPGGPDRAGDLDVVRRSLAKRMSVAYAEPLARMTEQFGDLRERVATDPAEFLDGTGKAGDPSPEEVRRRRRGARLFFTSIGVWEVEHLLTEPLVREITAATPEAIVTRRSVTLLLPRAILHRARAIQAIPGAGDHVVRAERSMVFPIDEPVLEPGLHGLLAGGWPGDVDRLVRWIDRLLTRRRGTLRSWHEHYNAACVISLLLKDWPGAGAPDDRTRTTIAEAAVTELEKAVACGNSGFIASQSSWILSEDPDLDELRSTEPFGDFAITVLGRRPGPARR